jgi:2-polyprenyl-6-methoxyphenol hydroxylase-like FAD-dependent oxidoreductase
LELARIRRAEHPDREARRHLVAPEDPQLQHAHDGDRARVGTGRLQAPAQHRHAPGWKSPIRFLASATGQEFGAIESKGFEGPGPTVSPCEPVMSSQELIEEILLDAARGSGLVDVRFGLEATRLVRGGADSDGDAAIEVVDRKSGAASLVRAPPWSRRTGPRASYAVSSICRSRGRRASRTSSIAISEPISNGTSAAQRRALLRRQRRGARRPAAARRCRRWLCQISVTPDEWSLDAFTKARARDWVRAAVGVDDLEPEILSLGLWKMNATVVERLVAGRIVLCGDAAHQFPPTGGLGVNTGLQGMHNAMWKLAYCVRGVARWPLLETYHDERRDVSQRITGQSLENSINVLRIVAAATGGESGMSTEDIVTASRRYGNHLGVEFGAAYASSAVVADGTSPPPVADSYSDYVQTATPGCRAPHVWLGRPDAQLSTLDLFGSAFTLLAAPAAGAWCDAP